MGFTYSSISKFLQCPRAFYHHYIVKDTTFEQSEAAAYGSDLHDFLDGVIKGTKQWSPRYEFLKPYVVNLMSIPGTISTEHPIAFKEDWTPTDWGDKQYYVKGKLDVLILHPDKPIALIKDWKASGKAGDAEAQKYAVEMDMFSWLTFKAYDVETIKTGLIWIKTKAPESAKVYDRKDLPELEDKMLGHISRIEDAISFDKFPCKPSGLCFGWCAARNCSNWKPKKDKR